MYFLSAEKAVAYLDAYTTMHQLIKCCTCGETVVEREGEECEGCASCETPEDENIEVQEDKAVRKHYKLDIDMQKVASGDLQTIIDILLPGIAERPFVGLRYIMARYEDRDRAYARALDIECAVYCGRVEIEEVNA